MKNKSAFILWAFLLPLLLFIGACSYSFNPKGTIPEGVKTVKVNFIENRAPIVNPQLSPNLSDRLRRKITSQTKLTQTNKDSADFVISGEIRDYSFSTSGISSNNSTGKSETSTNRLTITVHIILNNNKDGSTQEFDVSRGADFSANQSQQAAEAGLLDELVRNLTDEIFNHIFSNW